MNQSINLHRTLGEDMSMYYHESSFAAESHEFLLTGNRKVPLSSIDEKTNLLFFFSANWCRPCRKFTPLLIDLYNSINNTTTKKLEIIFVSYDKDESTFTEHHKLMPWLSAPFKSTLHKRLLHQYSISRIPALISSTSYGRAVGEDIVRLVEDYGVDAFPFSAQRNEELKAMDFAKLHGGSLMDLLGSSTRDHVISKDGLKVPIASLIGKTIGLYFGAHWCPPCLSFTAILAEAYNELHKSKKGEFEVIFVSTDRDEKEFKLSIHGMPWLAIPYTGNGRRDISRIFGVKGIPRLVLLGSDGRTMEVDGRVMVCSYGAKAFPFTPIRVTELEMEIRKEGEELPEHVMDSRHSHVLKLDRTKAYVCDLCKTRGRFWVFSCDECDFDVHPSCVVQKNNTIVRRPSSSFNV